ncbi:HlyD family secretion protein [Brevundimonas sp. SL130]|uniref:HlyD family secretion protein n=1 Tax=Brevundimonas sp. SL130 TaxID=2995143 RepID=UPI00226CC71B|nr:HlyD family efflux transporter periplasmic adaptor subunit [Brevundimonas sp. SL130]WAC60111.1 HlyD family efflux transporter periplasmic adaptor subunit [Brevundimonas sp. SL130]
MSDLFRKEAITHATRRLAGEVILASSVSSRVLAGLMFAVMLGSATFAATASYARKETVVGWLTPQAGMIRLAARQGGIVSNVYVREGDRVVVGQPIATLTLSSALEGGDSFEALARSLDAQGAAAGSRAAAAQAALAAEHRQLTERRAALGRELAETRRNIALQAERLTLARAEVNRAETIAAQGFLPRRELEARRSAELSVQQEASTLSSQALSYERQIGEVDARLAAIPIDIQAARAEAASTHAGLDQQATQAEAQGRYVVVATVAGRVAALPVDAGQTVAPGAAVAVLTAGDSALEAELYAPSRAAGFVKAGQEVRLLYQAFPHQKFGTGQGVVTSVSRTVLAPTEIAIPGLQVQEPVFRVRVKLARDSVEAYGQALPLQPGMLLSADVVIDRRTLLEWLLDPLYAAGRR